MKRRTSSSQVLTVSAADSGINVGGTHLLVDSSPWKVVQDALDFLMARLMFRENDMVGLNSSEEELAPSASFTDMTSLRLSKRRKSRAKPQKEVYAVPKESVVQRSFNARTPAQLILEVGDKVTNIVAVDDTWYKGEARGRVGQFPRFVVEDINDLIYEAEILQISGAQWDLGWRYLDAVGGVKEDQQKGASLLKKAAEQGSLDALLGVATLYSLGKGVEKDLVQAYKLYEEAALRGHPVAQDNLGDCYEDGNGVEQDAEKATYWFKRGAEQGYSYAQFSYAYCFVNGHGVPRDPERAFSLFMEAAMQGNGLAMDEIGDCYKTGYGVQRNLATAVEWFHKASEAGHAGSKVSIGLLYKRGEAGFPRDLAKAFALFQEAADKGAPRGQFELARLYEDGIFCAKDDVLAFSLFKKAAEQGLTSAQYSLAGCYWNAIGTEKDINLTFHWCEKAARRGHELAKIQLGHCHQWGYGTSANRERAEEWYKQAMVSYPLQAKVALGNLYLNTDFETLNVPEGVRLLREGADQGSVEGMLGLGNFYNYPPDEASGMANRDEAMYWFGRAAAAGEAEGRRMLEELCMDYVGNAKRKLP